MAMTVAIGIGAKVNCKDGSCGEVSRIVVDPVAQAVTHLVVESKHHPASGRLVPLRLVATMTPEVTLHCTRAEFDQLEGAHESDFLPGYGGHQDYSPEQVFGMPYFTLGSDLRMGGNVGMRGRSAFAAPADHDTVPLGEVDIHRGEPVRATDGEIGLVHGLVIDSSTHHVTHVLLQEGHLWGRKQIAIPIKAVTHVDGMLVNLSKEEVQNLPPVDIAEPAHQESGQS